MRTISVVVDNHSWILPWAQELVARVNDELGDRAQLLRRYEDVERGHAALFLGCVGVAPPQVLARNDYNLVPHASAVPHGRGFAPLVWQVIEGRTRIPVVLLEAAEDVDEGPVYLGMTLQFEGHELHDELRARLGQACVDLSLAFLAQPEPPPPVPQSGEPTWYRRRTPADSRLDPERSIAEQFDLLRTVDNERYPAFFDFRGHRYRLKIEKIE